MPAGSERPRKTGPPVYILQESGHLTLQFVLRDLLQSISSGILLTRILKGKMNPPLQRLNPSERPMLYHGNTSNMVIRLQLLNLPKEKVNLVHPTSPGIPTRLLHRGTKSAKRKRRRKIANIKPHRLPVDDLVTQFVRDILGFLPLTELKPNPPTTSMLESLG